MNNFLPEIIIKNTIQTQCKSDWFAADQSGILFRLISMGKDGVARYYAVIF